jgi:hypothetical protein
MLERIIDLNGRAPAQLSADVGTPRNPTSPSSPCAATASTNACGRWPHRNAMRERLATSEGKTLYKLHKQTVEPVFGQFKEARGLRRFLRRGLAAVDSEWIMAGTVHNLLNLQNTSLTA